MLQFSGDFILVRELRDLYFLVIHSLLSTLVDCTLCITNDQFLDADLDQKMSDRESRSTSTIDNNLDILGLLFEEPERIKYSRDDNNGCTVLIVMENRYVESLF